ncbi:MAG: DedA family protein [Phenylobacterium sp.]|uniref:DedA family protein n=1 Tax=Phenylobacterium sp. TaxID=1871053 RepID=UPI001A50502A|nr:DedA family protein [Phenylobacterium sp.]MBL8771794.1 DedA family protein [Phenylobacterium sp.]
MFEWIVAAVAAGGLVAVAFLMFAENVVPPIPSEVIMPLAGFAAAQGHLSFAGVVSAGTVGAVAGASAWKVVGRRVRRDRLRGWIGRKGHLLTLEPKDFDRAMGLFERHGAVAVFIGRLIPTVRTFISVPAGIVRMPWPSFLLWTSLGTALWTLGLASAGYVLAAEYDRVERWMDPVTQVVIAAVLFLYVYRVIRLRRQRR